MAIWKNPTPETFQMLMEEWEYGGRGIVAKSGDVYLGDGYDTLHWQIAAAKGITDYQSFYVYDTLEDNIYSLDNSAVYADLPFLRGFRVNTAGVIVEPKI